MAGQASEWHWPSGGGPTHREPARLTAFVLLLLAFALRLPMLGLRRLVEGDGVHYARLAEQILQGDISGLANPYWSNLWPGLIAITARLTGLGVVDAGRAAALVAGALLAPVTARLATGLFGRRTGIAAGLLVVGHPWLIHFSSLLFTESVFTLLLTAALLAAMSAPTRPASAAWAGLLCGLAVVTRPEAYGAAATIFVWLVWKAIRAHRAPRAALVFALLVGPCVFGRAWLIHGQTGTWDLGGTKAAANLLVGVGSTDREKERLASEFTPEGHRRLDVEIDRFSLVGYVTSHPLAVLEQMQRNGLLVCASLFRVFPEVPLVGGRPAPWEGRWPFALLTLASLALALALIGNVAGWLDRQRRAGTTLFSGVVLVHLLGLLPFLVHDRLIVCLVPLFLVFLAHGLVVCVARLRAHVSFADQRWLPAAIGLQALASLLLLLRAAPLLDYAGDPPVQREAGEWLRRHYAQKTRIMTASPFIAYYFYDTANAENELALPWADVAGITRLARSLGVDLIVVPEWHLQATSHPAAAALSRPPADGAVGLRFVTGIGDESGGRVIIYAVRALPGDAHEEP